MAWSPGSSAPGAPHGPGPAAGPPRAPLTLGGPIVAASAVLTFLFSFVQVFKVGDVGWSVWTTGFFPGLFGVGTLIPLLALTAGGIALARAFLPGADDRLLATFSLLQLQLVAVAGAVLLWTGFLLSVLTADGLDRRAGRVELGLGMLLLFIGLAGIVAGTVLGIVESRRPAPSPGPAAWAGDPTGTGAWPAADPSSGWAGAYGGSGGAAPTGSWAGTAWESPGPPPGAEWTAADPAQWSAGPAGDWGAGPAAAEWDPYAPPAPGSGPDPYAPPAAGQGPETYPHGQGPGTYDAPAPGPSQGPGWAQTPVAPAPAPVAGWEQSPAAAWDAAAAWDPTQPPPGAETVTGVPADLWGAGASDAAPGEDAPDRPEAPEDTSAVDPGSGSGRSTGGLFDPGTQIITGPPPAPPEDDELT